MRILRFLTCISLLCISFTSFSQKNAAKIKFGDVTPKDFAPTVYSLDSNASAIVLADIGESKYQGSNNGFFSLVFNRIRRIRLINKNGFEHATVEIPLYFSGSEEEMLSNFDAATYNIEDGKVVTTKLDKTSLFKDKYGKHHTVRKFTFPNIKEGSIIEFKYTITSPFYYNLSSWQFQEDLPCLWSEYQVTTPSDILDFVLLKKGDLNYVVDTSYSSYQSYNLLFPGGTEAAQTATLSSNTVTAHWAMQNIPALKDESYVTTLDNYMAKVDFQLRRIILPSRTIDYMGSWNQLVEDLMKDDNFGGPIKANNGWLTDELKKITAGATDNLGKAKKVYNYIRDNFTCSSNDGFYTTKALKKVFQDKNGTVGDINLLLTAAMMNLGIDATAAILSTRENGKANEIYPLIDQYNYVVCKIQIDDKDYVLDATNKTAGFGKLPEELYNGTARMITDPPLLITLSADSIHESKLTSVFIMNDSTGKSMSASFTSKLGDQEAMNMRQKMIKQSPEDYFKDKKKNFPFETNINETGMDSLKIADEPLTIRYNFTFSPNDEDIIYFTPLLTEAYKENPFKSAERKYPVEMPYCSDETYVLNMEIPKGYKVEELPKSARVKLNDNEGMFEYIIAEGTGRVQLRCRILLNKANFDPDDYQTLRDFFGFIVKKEAEQIVFKKL